MVLYMLTKIKSLLKKEQNKEVYLRKLAILEVEPINFTIRNEQENWTKDS